MATVVIDGVTYSLNHKPSCMWSRGAIYGNVIHPIQPNTPAQEDKQESEENPND